MNVSGFKNLTLIVNSKTFINIRLLLTIMARSNKVNLPSGMGGLTRYFDDYTSKIELKPGHVVILAVIIMLIVVFLHIQGSAFLGIV